MKNLSKYKSIFSVKEEDKESMKEERRLDSIDYATALIMVSDTIDKLRGKKFTAFEASTLLAIMFGRSKEETLDDLMNYRS